MAHNFAKQSLVRYACPPIDGKTRDAAAMCGAGLSGRKTGRDFRVDSEKITVRFPARRAGILL